MARPRWCEDSQSYEQYCHVYVIGPEGGPYKIGIAVDVAVRLIDLQIGNHLELKVLASVKVPGSAQRARSIEEQMHWAFWKRRVRGEWFDIPLAEAEAHLQRLTAPKEEIAA